MAQCRTFPKGNIKAWEENNLKVYKATTKSIPDAAALFCKDVKHLIIFPERQPLHVAKRICKIHGGKLVTPVSYTHLTLPTNREV